jgi:hypothetical protein
MDMNISKDNYESWFLDYIEGKLESAQREKLMSFLDFNPDLKAELEGMNAVLLEPDDMKYLNKDGLKKPDEFESLCISSIENQLTSEEEGVFKRLLSEDQNKQQIFSLYQSTLLAADKQIIYPKKSRLRKRFIDLPGFRLSISAVAAAAAVLVALTLMFRDKAGPELVTHNPDTGTDIKSQNIEKAAEPDEPLGNLGATNPSGNKELDPGSVHAFEIQSERNPDTPSESVVLAVMNEQINRPEPGLLSRIEPQISAGLQHPGMDRVPLLVLPERGPSMDDYPGIAEFAMARLKRRNRKVSDPEKFSLWKLADNSIDRINEISEEDYSLERKLDEEGRTRRFTFESPVFGISAPLRNTDQPQ